LRDKTYAVPGNHEYKTRGAKGYFDYWNGSNTVSQQAGERGRGYYSVNVGSWHVIALNSNCADVGGCETSSPQGTWLQTDLQANKTNCTLAFWHHPRYTSGQHNDALEVSDFWKTLYDHNADVVLNGHDHLYERFAKQSPEGKADPVHGIREFIAGAGGKSLYKFKSVLKENHEAGNNQQFGYLLLTLHNQSYSWQYKTIDGTVVDRGSSSCNN
jgi:hypothetical protein